MHPSKKIVSSEPKVSVFKRIRGSISPTFKQKADSSTNEKAKSRKSSDSLSEKPVSKASSNKSVASRKRKRQKENGEYSITNYLASVSKSKYQKICENNERSKLCLSSLSTLFPLEIKIMSNLEKVRDFD